MTPEDEALIAAANRLRDVWQSTDNQHADTLMAAITGVVNAADRRDGKPVTKVIHEGKAT